MRSIQFVFSVFALVCPGVTVACSSNSSPHTKEDQGLPDAGGEPDVVGNFTVALISAGVAGGTNPPHTNIAGQVYDGPYPELTIEKQLPIPADATPGCAVYGMDTPDCSSIGGCGLASTNGPCAAAATTGVNSCVCVATNTCQAYPTRKNVGTVTVTGVSTASGATSLILDNNSNAYLADPITLSYPGFSEGAPISISASGGDYLPFEIEAKGVAALTLTNSDFHFARDTSSADPTKYQAFELTWNPPNLPDLARVQVELNISRHAGTVGYLSCDVEDTGSLVISSSLISQLVMLGNIAGFPELNVTRSASAPKEIAPGIVELVVESNVEVFPTIENYSSCLVNADCPTGQVCNTTVKLCE